MEPNIISIRCIHCGAILQVRNQEGIEKLSVTCPNCHEKFSVADGIASHAKMGNNQDSERTIYGPQKQNPPKGEDTILGTGALCIGHLLNTATGETYSLRLGQNTIGRASNSSGTTIRIEDPTRKMSREHATIEVNRMHDGTYRHFIRNWHNKNKTYVGGKLLEDGDSFVLMDQQEIKFASVTLRFIIPNNNNEETQY